MLFYINWLRYCTVHTRLNIAAVISSQTSRIHECIISQGFGLLWVTWISYMQRNTCPILTMFRKCLIRTKVGLWRGSIYSIQKAWALCKPSLLMVLINSIVMTCARKVQTCLVEFHNWHCQWYVKLIFKMRIRLGTACPRPQAQSFFICLLLVRLLWM